MISNVAIGDKTNVIKYIYISKAELGLCDLGKISNCNFSDRYCNLICDLILLSQASAQYSQ